MQDWIVPVLSGVLALVTALITSIVQTRSSLSRYRQEVEQGYAHTLFEARVTRYPALYTHLSGYLKLMLYGKANRSNLAEFRENVDCWNSEHSMFFTPKTSRLSAKFRYYLRELLDCGASSPITEDQWKAIKYAIGEFETAMRAEIGIFDTNSVGVAPGIEEAHKALDREIEKLKASNQKGLTSASN